MIATQLELFPPRGVQPDRRQGVYGSKFLATYICEDCNGNGCRKCGWLGQYEEWVGGDDVSE